VRSVFYRAHNGRKSPGLPWGLADSRVANGPGRGRARRSGSGDAPSIDGQPTPSRRQRSPTDRRCARYSALDGHVCRTLPGRPRSQIWTDRRRRSCPTDRSRATSTLQSHRHTHMPLHSSTGLRTECPDVKNYKWRLNPVWHRMLYIAVPIWQQWVSKGYGNISRLQQWWNWPDTWLHIQTDRIV